MLAIVTGRGRRAGAGLGVPDRCMVGCLQSRWAEILKSILSPAVLRSIRSSDMPGGEAVNAGCHKVKRRV